MSIFYSIMLVAFLVVLAILLIRYVNATVDKEFRNLAKAAADDGFRTDELARVDGLLVGAVPLPADVKPLSGPVSGGMGALPPVLLAVGVILLWGMGSAHEERRLWFIGAMVCFVLSALVMLCTLRRRKMERVARLLRFRADLKRMAGDRKGAAADLVELVKLTPWDDASWAELSDDRDAQGDLAGALDAIGQAARLDPMYDEYRMIEASIAIRLGRLDQARTSIEIWKEMDRVRPDDPRLIVYQAALLLAEGHRDEAVATLKNALLDADLQALEFLDTDQALADIRDLLPGRGGDSRRSETHD